MPRLGVDEHEHDNGWPATLRDGSSRDWTGTEVQLL